MIDRQPRKAQREEQGRTEIGCGSGASSHPGVKVTFQDLVLGAGGWERLWPITASARKDALRRIGRRWAGLATVEQEALGTRRKSAAGPGKGKLAGGVQGC